MKTKTPYILLAAWAIICGVIAVVGLPAGEIPALMSVPFAQIGAGLRRLSLSGGAGNIAAIIIYVAIGGFPLAAAVGDLIKKRFKAKDILLLLLSILLFGVLYGMINPALINRWGSESLPIMRSMLGGGIWSCLLAWAVFALLDRVEGGGREKLLRWMGALLWLLAAVFVAAAVAVGGGELRETMRAVAEANRTDLIIPELTQMNSWGSLGTTCFFLVIRFIVGALEYLLDAALAIMAAELMRSMAADRYSEDTLLRSEKLGKFCVLSLKITVIAGLALNALQLLLMNSLAVMDVNVTLPVTSIAFTLAMLLFVRLMREGKELKDDNDMFI